MILIIDHEEVSIRKAQHTQGYELHNSLMKPVCRTPVCIPNHPKYGYALAGQFTLPSKGKHDHALPHNACVGSTPVLHAGRVACLPYSS